MGAIHWNIMNSWEINICPMWAVKCRISLKITSQGKPLTFQVLSWHTCVFCASGPDRIKDPGQWPPMTVESLEPWTSLWHCPPSVRAWCKVHPPVSGWLAKNKLYELAFYKFSKYFLSTIYVPGIALGIWAKSRDRNLCPLRHLFLKLVGSACCLPLQFQLGIRIQTIFHSTTGPLHVLFLCFKCSLSPLYLSVSYLPHLPQGSLPQLLPLIPAGSPPQVALFFYALTVMLLSFPFPR